MPKITYVTDDGQKYTIAAESGISAMETAVRNGVPGIDGDCGGAAACGTCHVYVDDGWREKVGPAQPGIEQEMIGLIDNTAPASRLACQIRITEELDGLILRMPAGQH